MKIHSSFWGLYALIFLFFQLSAQPITFQKIYSGAGIVNAYTPVTGFECDSTSVRVGSAAEFSPGDEVLIIQMQGAVVDSSNTANFGLVNDFGTTGNYEFNRIQSISGNDIQLKFALTKSYDVAGKIQLIRVPEYSNTATDALTCQPWDGLTGGVLVIDVANTLTLMDDIDVSSKGFRGGIFVNDVNTSYHETQFVYPPAPSLSAAKGEGVAIISLNKSYGRGRSANGGGGGNAANAGGGGGANAGNGGHGGEEYYNTPSTPTPGTQGLGGNKLFENSLDRIIMGGGGGAGHSNDFQGSSGGNGGGIIIIKANTIVSNSHALRASGEDIFGPGGTNVNDGQGGGGGGGTILLDVEAVNGSLLCNVHGGRGGDCLFYVQSQIIGPGGGGSGGKIAVSQTLPSLVFDIDGGVHGIANQNLFNKSQNGESGKILTDLTLAIDHLLPSIELNIVPFMCSALGQITVLNEPNSVFSLNNGPFQPSPTFSNLASGQYLITVQNILSGCIKDSTIALAGMGNVLLENTITFCPGASVSIDSVIYSSPVILIDTIPDQSGCDTILTTRLEYVVPPRIEHDTLLCFGDSITINGIQYGQAAVVTDTIHHPNSCDTVSITTIRLDNVNAPFLPADTILCPGEMLQLVSPFSETSWNGVLTSSPLEVQLPGTIVAFAFDENHCLRRDTIQIGSCCSEKNIYVPNIFSPNDDQENDEFCVYPISRCAEYELHIYDRWGELMFESQQSGVCWDGSFRGKPAAVGVYIWTMKFYSEAVHQEKVLSGDVTLIR